MDPIATYTERLFQVRREFALHEDRIVIRARWLLRGQYEHTVQLTRLKPEPRPLQIRQKTARWAKWACALGLLGLAIAVYQAHGGPVSPLAYVGGAVAAAGLSVLMVTFQKVRFARFETEEGKAGLDIGRAGPDKQRFDEFVGQVVKQIRKARRR